MTFFNELALPLVVAVCLILGYIIKQWIKDVDNKYIPTILAAVGVVLACLIKKDISVEIVVCGTFSGLISTGLHQAFKQLLGGGAVLLREGDSCRRRKRPASG